MPQSLPHEDVANRLLISLPAASLKRLWPALEFRSMERGDVIASENQPIDYFYFVNRGLISLVKTMQDGRAVEIGVVGNEGCSGLHAILGHDRALLDAMVQIPGTAYRIKSDKLKTFLAEDADLGDLMKRYSHFANSAFAQTGACNRLHQIEERCCRWLLIANDSASSDTFQLTQEYLAMMLGVQRTGVSITASSLQKAGLISYKHGKMTIRDRAGLEDMACECYATMREKYDAVVRARKKRLTH